jgi:ribosomal protein S18 acetylase RimI-like enzyme
MEKKLPENYSSRMATNADIPAIHQLETNKSLHYYGVPGIILERLINEYSSPGFEIDKSILLVEDLQGNLAANVEVWDISDPPVHPYVYLSVDPKFENQGLEEHLLEWAEDRAKEVLERVDPELRIAIRSHAEHRVESSGKARMRAGYQKIRHGFRMMIELEVSPDEPVWPDGVSLRLYDPDLDARTVFELDEEVFEDHFGFVKEDPETGFEKFMHHMTGDDSYDPSLWFLAEAEGEVVGLCICRLYGPDDRDTGWVSSLGVKRAWRRKGIALNLLRHAFGVYYQRGIKKVGLGVDAESLTGATDLYKKAGMSVHRQFDLYEKEMRPGKVVSVTTLETSEE